MFLVCAAVSLPARVTLAASLATAPMCDQDASSVSAPIPALPSRSGVLAAPPRCEDTGLARLGATKPPNDSSHQPLSFERTDRILPAVLGFAHPPASRLPVAAPSRVLPPPSHALGVYRPPR
jgi:hypothetical protein